MTNEGLEQAIIDIYDGFNELSETEPKYRERKEALGALDKMAWFDNFGEHLYRRRMLVAKNVLGDYEVSTEFAREVRDFDDPL